MSVYVRLQLVKLDVVRQVIAPAWEAFERGETRPILEVFAEVSAGDWASLPGSPIDQESLEQARALMDTVRQRLASEPLADLKPYLTQRVMPEVAYRLCLDRRVRNPDQDMTKREVVRYLYRHSQWIQDLFTFMLAFEGGVSPFPTGVTSELLGHRQVEKLRDELERIPLPTEDRLRTELSGLQEVVAAACDGSDRGLLVTTF